jgi:peptide-methionine (S)-S-oxide reductase
MKFILLSIMTCSAGLFSCAQKSKSMSAEIPKMVSQNETKETGKKLDTITLGAGCFWCVEAVFQELKGVEGIVSGYSGGHIENPTYEEVCSKTSGHAEVCQLYYDPALVSIDEILEVYWKTHDPTTMNRQGNDAGPQYRSVIFYHNPLQKEKAEYYKKIIDSSGAYDAPLVTTIEPFTRFYAAENYHQNYYKTNPNQGYCTYVIQPKVEKFRKIFKDKLKNHK